MRFVLVLAFVAAVSTGCGKVGDPLPPSVRIPEAASDFTVTQVAYRVFFQWTSPVRNVDFSASTDLAFAEVLAEETLVERVEAVPGQLQVVEIDASDIAGIPRAYVVRFVTEEDRTSEPSNTVAFTVAEVPEGGATPEALVDQRAVRLTWPEPAVNPGFATAYHVYRSGALLAPIVSAPPFDDRRFDTGSDYVYRVVPVREFDGRVVEGVAYETVVVEAVDRTPPAPPANVMAVTYQGGAFLRWEEGAETDLAFYRVYSIDGPNAMLLGEPTTTGFDAAGAGPGSVYAVSAVDESGNESARSAEVTVR